MVSELYLNRFLVVFFPLEEQFNLEFELNRETLKLTNCWVTLFGLERLLAGMVSPTSSVYFSQKSSVSALPTC